MPEVLWFLSGCAFALLMGLSALWLYRRFLSSQLLASQHVDQDPAAELDHEPEAVAQPKQCLQLVIGNSGNLEALADGLGKDLSSLASSVEGHAQLLCESLGSPRRIAEQAERLWEAVRRLRFFSEKMQAFAPVSGLNLEPVNLRQLLTALAMELENYSGGGLQVGLYTAPCLPMAMADADALRIALLFLVEGLLGMEPDAGTLNLHAHTELDEQRGAQIRIEIEAEMEESGEPCAGMRQGMEFSCLAARNLLEAQCAKLTLEHIPGLSALATLSLPATETPRIGVGKGEAKSNGLLQGPVTDASPLEETFLEPEPEHELEPEPEEVPAHNFGGVLIMESNPSIRDLVAREIQASNRNIIACADGIAARALFQATPERFELLILEQDSRRLAGDELAALAVQTNPNLKIILLTHGPGWAGSTRNTLGEDCIILHKPFGVVELRHALQQILGPEPAPTAYAEAYAVESASMANQPA